MYPNPLSLTLFCWVQRAGDQTITLTAGRKARQVKGQAIWQTGAGYEISDVWITNSPAKGDTGWRGKGENGGKKKTTRWKEAYVPVLTLQLTVGRWTNQTSILSYRVNSFILEVREVDKAFSRLPSTPVPPGSEDCLHPMLPLENIILLMPFFSCILENDFGIYPCVWPLSWMT